jgi:hypothetical protein
MLTGIAVEIDCLNDCLEALNREAFEMLVTLQTGFPQR